MSIRAEGSGNVDIVSIFTIVVFMFLMVIMGIMIMIVFLMFTFSLFGVVKDLFAVNAFLALKLVGTYMSNTVTNWTEY